MQLCKHVCRWQTGCYARQQCSSFFLQVQLQWSRQSDYFVVQKYLLWESAKNIQVNVFNQTNCYDWYGRQQFALSEVSNHWTEPQLLIYYDWSGWVCQQGRCGMQAQGEVCQGVHRVWSRFHHQLIMSALLKKLLSKALDAIY